MNTTNRTLTFVAVAAFAVLSAVGVKYINRPIVNADFADVGQEFFSAFTDPLKATSLSVAKYDGESREPIAFAVKQNDKGLWVIPSHHDYPAEAADRLARTAASFIGAKKIALQSRSKDDWGRYGVADPEDDVAVDPDAKEGEKDESRGTRVTLRDSGGNALVDLIIGKPVEDRSQNYYVRQPDKNNVYIAEIGADLSAKFSDWIEPDLLKLNQSDIVRVLVDKYSIDEDKGEILRSETLEFDKDPTTNKWTLAGLNAEAESVKEAAVNDLTKNLDQLKIVGVRPKPEGLNADLTVSAEMASNPVIMEILQADMQRQGFFIARGENGKKMLVSNEGELVAGTKNGVRYTLYFGEVARGSAKDIETGLNEKTVADQDVAKTATVEEKKDENSGDDAPKNEIKPVDTESGPRRYLLVKVEFDESLMGKKPAEPVAPEKPVNLNSEASPAEAKEETPATEATKSASDAVPVDDAAAPKADAAPQTEVNGADNATLKGTEQDGADESAAGTSISDEKSADEPVAPEPATSETAPKSEGEQPTLIEPPSGDANPEILPATPSTEPLAAKEEEKPAATNEALQEPESPADPSAEAQKQYLQALGQYESEKEGFADALKSWEKRSTEGRKLAEELSTRFGAWYYVISADSFEKLRPSRVDIVGPKEAAKPGDTSTPPNFDSPLGGIPGLGE